MSLVFDLLKAFGFGLFAYLAIPIIAYGLPKAYAESVVRPYQKQAMAMIKGGIFLWTGRGLKLKKSKRDTRYNAEKLKVGGEWKYFRDKAGLMHTLYGYPLGLAHEDKNVILDARTLYYARRFRELLRDGDFTDGDFFRAYIGVDADTPELVSLRDALAVIQKNAPPGLASRTEDYGEKAEAGFNSPTYTETFELILYLLVGAGLVLVLQQARGAAGGVSTGDMIPIMLGVL